MSVQVQSAVSPNFAEFLLDSAENGNEILAVLDDIAEVTETALWCATLQTEHQTPYWGFFNAMMIASNELKLCDIQSTAHPHLMRIPHLLTLTIVGVYALTYPKNMDMLRYVTAIA